METIVNYKKAKELVRKVEEGDILIEHNWYKLNKTTLDTYLFIVKIDINNQQDGHPTIWAFGFVNNEWFRPKDKEDQNEDDVYMWGTLNDCKDFKIILNNSFLNKISELKGY